MIDRFKIGKLGEEIARGMLEEKGCQILASRYRSPYGEIDLIARHNRTLCFIEVKLRKSLAYGLPEESINETKIGKITKTAEYYLQQESPHEYDEIRFDVISILLESSLSPKIRWIQSAFCPQS